MTQCARCGASIAAENRFCTACGAPATAEVGAPAASWGGYAQPTSSTAPPPSSYTPPGAQNTPPQYMPPGYAPYGPPPKPVIRRGFVIAAAVVGGLFMLLSVAAALTDATEDANLDAEDYEVDDPDLEAFDTSLKWWDYHASDGSFRAAFPQEPEVSHESWSPLADAPPQDITLVSASGFQYWFEVEHDPLPPGRGADPAAVAREAAEYWAETNNGTISNGTSVVQDGRAAYEFRIDWNDSSHGMQVSRCRTVVDGDQVYWISVTGRDAAGEEFDRFVRSFELLHAPAFAATVPTVGQSA